jgi:thioredoxin 1
MAGANTQEFNEQNFEAEVLQSSVPVLVDFWAEWCGPCKRLGPIIDDVAAAVDGKAKVGKVNVDECPGLAARYNVRAIPTVIIFKDGEVSNQQVGLTDKASLVAKLS